MLLSGDMPEEGGLRKMKNRVSQMKRTAFLVFSALMVGGFIIGLVWAQETSPRGVFTGIITKVDPEEGIVVRNPNGEMLFQWGPETMVNGLRLGEGGSISEKLKEGMEITVSYTEVERNRVASEIGVKGASVGITKGWELPFGCGMSVC
jgi:hypothetical protein